MTERRSHLTARLTMILLTKITRDATGRDIPTQTGNPRREGWSGQCIIQHHGYRLHPLCPATTPGDWDADPWVIYERYRLAWSFLQPHESPRVEPRRVEPQIRRNSDESPQW